MKSCLASCGYMRISRPVHGLRVAAWLHGVRRRQQRPNIAPSSLVQFRLLFHSVRSLSRTIPALGLLLLIAALGGSRVLMSGTHAGHHLAHAHHPGGVSHQHIHSHHHHHRSELGHSPTPSRCADLGSGGDHDHHCCGVHHHDHPSDDTLAIREREPVPTSVALAFNTDDAFMRAVPRVHRQLWPYPTGRPPDYLIRLRTVVLLT